MLNISILQGRLTSDPELKTTPNGVTVTSFSLAVERSYAKDGNRATDFINIVAWRATAEFICKYFRKGDMILLNGELQQRSYTDKDGNKRTAYDVVANNVNFCGGKTERKSADVECELPDTDDFEDIGDGDLPF